MRNTDEGTTPDGLPATVEVKQSSGHTKLDRSAVETVRT
ncbi:energy transducer TonB [Variovorax sp. 54]|nr:energy transducer TonB [Variovorax sp. 54]